MLSNALARLWGLDEDISRKVIRKLVDCSFITSSTNVQIHDLCLDLINDRVSKSERKLRSSKVLIVYKKKENLSKSRDWWSVEDDGYIFNNV